MLEMYRTACCGGDVLRMSLYCGLFEDPYRLQAETTALLKETKKCEKGHGCAARAFHRHGEEQRRNRL